MCLRELSGFLRDTVFDYVDVLYGLMSRFPVDECFSLFLALTHCVAVNGTGVHVCICVLVWTELVQRADSLLLTFMPL